MCAAQQDAVPEVEAVAGKPRPKRRVPAALAITQFVWTADDRRVGATSLPLCSFWAAWIAGQMRIPIQEL